MSYTLHQEGNFNQIKYLAETLKGKTHYNNGVYETTVNTTKLSKIINYLNIHPLKTNKSIVYFNIRKIYILIREKKSLINEDIKLLTKYKNNFRLFKFIWFIFSNFFNLLLKSKKNFIIRTLLFISLSIKKVINKFFCSFQELFLDNKFSKRLKNKFNLKKKIIFKKINIISKLKKKNKSKFKFNKRFTKNNKRLKSKKNGKNLIK